MAFDNRLLVLFTSLGLGIVVGCSSGRDEPGAFTNDDAGVNTPGVSSQDDDPSLSTPDEQAELLALDIGPDEPIVDEGDVATADGADSLPDNPLDAEDVTDADIEDDGTADELATSSVHAQLAGTLGVPNANVGSTKNLANSWTCVTRINGTNRRDTIGKCVCAGSPLNCEVPNTQPGKNRLLRSTWDADLDSEGVAKADHGTWVDYSSWDVNPETALYEGGGAPRGNMHGTCYVPNPAKDPTRPFVGDGSHSCAKINYGQIKMMAPAGMPSQKFVYAFSVRIGGAKDENSIPASGWIPFSSIGSAVSAELAKMPTAAPARPTALKFAKTHYVVRSEADYTDSEKSSAFKESKVGNNPAAQEGSNKKVGDYLEHDGIINLAFGTPGVGGPATDTRAVGDHTLLFRRALSSKYPTLVYSKTSVSNSSDSGRKRLVFAFGEIGGRFGWLALPAFMKGDRVAKDPCEKVSGTVAACDVALGYSGFSCTNNKLQKRFTCPTATPSCQGGAPDGSGIVCISTTAP